jgi:hypothetical protein
MNPGSEGSVGPDFRKDALLSEIYDIMPPKRQFGCKRKGLFGEKGPQNYF